MKAKFFLIGKLSKAKLHFKLLAWVVVLRAGKACVVQTLETAFPASLVMLGGLARRWQACFVREENCARRTGALVV